MAQVSIIYGNEPQLIEEKKQEILQRYKTIPITTLRDTIDPVRISESLCEDSLFDDERLFLLIDPPVFKKSGKREDPAWNNLYNSILQYKGKNPVVIIYHDTIDKRIKTNMALLNRVESIECKRLEGGELLAWIRNYCIHHGFKITPDGIEYIRHLMELWQDVSVSFMRTELDRYFLQLGDHKIIDQQFLETNSSDYGAKNIFTFKEALLQKNVSTLLELFPFMLGYKEIDRAMSYIEGQLRLQLMVSECRSLGMSRQSIENLCKEKNSSIKSYPIKLAYNAAHEISISALEKLLVGLYTIMTDSRQGKSDMWQFRDLCIAYCKESN